MLKRLETRLGKFGDFAPDGAKLRELAGNAFEGPGMDPGSSW